MSRIGDLIDDFGYPVRRGVRGAGERVGALWFGRPLEFRRRAAGVAALIVLYAVLKVGASALPCQLPAGDDCAPKDDLARIVPGDAMLYAHISLGSGQYDKARSLAGKLPHAEALLASAVAGLDLPSGENVDIARDLEPWRGDEAGVIRLPGPGSGDAALLVAARDEKKALAFAGKIGPGKARNGSYKGHPLRLHSGGFTTALVDGFLVAGNLRALRRVIDTTRLPGAALGASALPKSVRDALPAQRFADVYLSRQGIRLLLAGRGGYAGQLDTFTDFSASRAIAGSAQAHGSGVEFQLESALNPKLAKRHPPFFRAFGPFEPGLAGELSDEALLYFGVGDLQSSITALLRQAAQTSPGLALSLRGFRARLSARAKVDIARKALPLLGGEAAIAIEPTARVPYAALVVDGVEEKRARELIGELAPSIARAAGTRGNIASRLSSRDIEGVRAASIRLSPTVNLTMAAFDGKLVVATDPAGVKEVRSGEAPLSGSSIYRKTTSRVGGEVSALVFLNLEELFRLAERAGLAEDLTYATFAEDIHTLKALGVGVNTPRDKLSTTFFLTIE